MTHISGESERSLVRARLQRNSGSGRKGGLVPGVSPDGFDDGGESKAVVDDYKFKLQKAEQDINTLQTNVSRTKDSFITTWTEMSFSGWITDVQLFRSYW